jgi:hypothetical protein
MRLLQALALAVAAAGGLAIMPSSADAATYRYCMVGTPNMFTDCSFNTLQQCQMTASAGVGFCQENSAYIAATRGVPIRR